MGLGGKCSQIRRVLIPQGSGRAELLLTAFPVLLLGLKDHLLGFNQFDYQIDNSEKWRGLLPAFFQASAINFHLLPCCDIFGTSTAYLLTIRQSEGI